MPTVRTYEGRQVARDALPGVRKQAGETPLSAGVGLEHAKAETWGAVAHVAAGVGGLAAKAIAEETDRADQVAVLEYANGLSAFKQKRMLDPTSGALTVKGKAAMPLPETVGEEFRVEADRLERALATPRQRAAAAKERAQQGLELDLTLRRHVLGEMQTYEKQELASFVANSTNEARALALSPDHVDALLDRVTEKITLHAPRTGAGPDAVAHEVAAAQTAIHVGVLESLLAGDKDRLAKIYFEKHQGQIVGSDNAKMAAAVDTATTTGAGLRAASAIWDRLGPTDDTAPVAFDAMQTAAREQFEKDDDTKAYTATMNFLRERKAAVDAARQDRKEQTGGALWGAVAQSLTNPQITLATVQRMPEYLSAPGALQAQITDRMLREVEQKADRSYMLENRGKDAAAHEEQAKELAGWTMLWHYDTPEILNMMNENQIAALAGDLGIQHVNRLLAKKRAIGKSDDTVRAATIDDDLFKTTAKGAGLDAYTPKTDTEKADLGQLRNVVETAIDREQQAKGRALTRDQKQALMTGIIDQHVMLTVNYGSDRQAIAAMVTNPDDRAKAYVPMAKVKPKPLAGYLNMLRSVKNPGLNDAQLQYQYGAQIERAEALRLFGASDADIDAALLGPEP